MGMPKKRSRAVAVIYGGEEKPFRYMVKETTIPGHYDQKELSVTVQEDTKRPGNVFQFRTSWGRPITAAVMQKAITEALKKGWQPSKRGAAFSC